MKRTLTTLVAAGLLGAAAAAAPAQQRPEPVDHEVELEIGDSAAVDATGTTAGFNLLNVVEGGDYHCEDTPHEACEVILVKVVNEYDEENASKGRERANLTLALDFFNAGGVYPLDMAIQVWETDEDGERGELVGTADNNPPDGGESMAVVVTSTPDESEFFYRVEVIHGLYAGPWTMNLDFAN